MDSGETATQKHKFHPDACTFFNFFINNKKEIKHELRCTNLQQHICHTFFKATNIQSLGACYVLM